MLNTLFASVAGDLSPLNACLIILSSLLLGLLISLTYLATHRKEVYARSFPVTLIMLPAIIAIIILLVGNHVARAFSLAGAFSLICFRSAPGDPKDIAYVFFTLGVGLACGMGYIGYAVLFAVIITIRVRGNGFLYNMILCAVMACLQAVRFGQPKTTQMTLKITVPENLNFHGLFDDLLEQYTVSWTRRKVKTCDFGSLFEVVYDIQLKDEAGQKEFLDAIRRRNGNLNISLTLAGEPEGTF